MRRCSAVCGWAPLRLRRLRAVGMEETVILHKQHLALRREQHTAQFVTGEINIGHAALADDRPCASVNFLCREGSHDRIRDCRLTDAAEQDAVGVALEDPGVPGIGTNLTTCCVPVP